MKPFMIHRVSWALSLLISACTPASHEGLEEWLQAERQAALPPLQTLPEPAPITPPTYTVTGLAEPFSNDRASIVAPHEPATTTPDWILASRGARPPLEAFPLDSMTLVGTLSSGAKQVALVKVGQQIHPVRLGDHLGLYQGRVRRITEQGIEVSERLQDANGAWAVRLVSMPIREEPAK
jgi:type IV pilus assembly protein PilP